MKTKAVRFQVLRTSALGQLKPSSPGGKTAYFSALIKFTFFPMGKIKSFQKRSQGTLRGTSIFILFNNYYHLK